MGSNKQDIKVVTYTKRDGSQAITAVTSKQQSELSKTGRLVKTHKTDGK
ncbi:MAG TPA: hypothetical protein VK663_08090 [Burkholderiales bacterium]|nr:hypothetical protein [Burkholderiales bacterium]